MTYTKQSPLIKVSGHYTAQQLYAAFEPMIPAGQHARVRILIDCVVVLCKRFHLDELVVMAIVWIESGYGNKGLPFRHPNYLKENNLGNLGKTGDPAQDAAAQTWATIEDAVNGLMAHAVAYAYGSGWRTVWDVDDLGKPQTWDKRFDLAINNTPNRAGVKTIGDLNRRWAIDRDDDYGGKLAERANKLVAAMDPPVDVPSTPEEPVEGEPSMPLDPEDLKPDVIDAFVTKRSDGQGFNYGTRAPIAGLVVHERQGRIGTAKVGQQFFACLTDTSCTQYGICRDGERCQNALVDWEILRNGDLVEYQDPYDTNRIPWASGGAENNGNLIGQAINAKYRGLFGGVNRVFAAVEIEKTDNEACTPEQIQTAGKLMAYVMAKAGYPANDWEYPDVLGGDIYTVPHHSDISQTSCRISDSDKAAMKTVCSKALAAYYQGTTPGEEPQPEPPKPVEEVIPGLDYSVAARLFGIAKGEDGVSYKFDKNGPVSQLWLANGKATGEWPALTSVYSYENGARRYFVFDGGDTVIAVNGQAPRWLKEAA